MNDCLTDIVHDVMTHITPLDFILARVYCRKTRFDAAESGVEYRKARVSEIIFRIMRFFCGIIREKSI